MQGGSQGFESPQLHRHEEGSHRGLVRPPAKWLLREIGVVGSNPTPSAIFFVDIFAVLLSGKSPISQKTTRWNIECVEYMFTIGNTLLINQGCKLNTGMRELVII